jgi:hypothetical protein
VGGKAQGSSNTSPESDQRSPNHESSRPEAHIRNDEEALGGTEESEVGVVS